MGKSVESLKTQMSKIRTGRAHPSLLDGIQVEYYGAATPLKTVGQRGGRRCPHPPSISIFDRSMIRAVEKSHPDLRSGPEPVQQRPDLRVPLPPLTEERRRDLTKDRPCRSRRCPLPFATSRRDANADLKALLKKRDLRRRRPSRPEEIQKLTDTFIKLVDDALVVKEKELMEI